MTLMTKNYFRYKKAEQKNIYCIPCMSYQLEFFMVKTALVFQSAMNY
jgi:hypothetical protein